MALTRDLTALFNAVDAKAGLAERNRWLVRLLEWLRHAPSVAATVPLGRVLGLPIFFGLPIEVQQRPRIHAASWRQLRTLPLDLVRPPPR